VQQVGTPNTLYHAPANQFVAGFIGSPKMNFLEGSIAAVSAETLTVRYANGETQEVAVAAGHASIGDKVTVGIRPEHLKLDAQSGGVGARVMTVESLGDTAYLYAECAVSSDGLIARISPLAQHRKGESIRLAAAPQHCHLFDATGLAFERKVVEVLSAA